MARLHAQCHPGGKAEMAAGDTDLLTAHLGVPAEGMGQLIVVIYTEPETTSQAPW